MTKYHQDGRLWRYTLPLVLTLIAATAPSSAVEYLSPITLIAEETGSFLYVAESGADQIVEFDLAREKVARRFSLPHSPSGLALAPDGHLLFVTGGAANGRVMVVDLSKGKVVKMFPAGHTPNSPTISADGATLYVCNRFDNDVSAIDLDSGEETSRMSVAREPVAAAISPDGKSLFVANHLPASAADGDFIAAEISVCDTRALETVSSIPLANGATVVRGICISPDGKYAYVTHILARYQLPTSQFARGWRGTNAIAIIDVATQSLVNTVLLDGLDLGAADPWGVACSPDGKFLCAAHSGTHEISIIDRAALHRKLDAAEADGTGESVSRELTFISDVRRRLRLPGNGPRGVAVAGGRAYVAEYFSDSLGVAELSLDNQNKARSVALGWKPRITLARRGEILFHDATICFQNWQSCASCHPAGRVDGLNWDLLNDGIGTPKNTLSLLLAYETPPSMTTADTADAETTTRGSLKSSLYADRPEEDSMAIDAYLKSLKPVQSPYLRDGKLSPSAKRGREIYQRAACASCHPEPLYTDLKSYEVGTGAGLEKGGSYDTPTLAEIWRTAPYLHDGRSATMKDVLTVHNETNRHGGTADLTESEIADLAEFVLSQ